MDGRHLTNKTDQDADRACLWVDDLVLYAKNHMAQHLHRLSLAESCRERAPFEVLDIKVDGKRLDLQVKSSEFVSPFGWDTPDWSL